MIPGSDPSAAIEFGRFTIRPLQREFLADGQPIELGGRAFDVLVALIGALGTLVSKDELMSRVWAGRIVEENSLEAQISALRKALGPDRDLIRTVAGRGYQFTGEIRGAAAAEIAAPPHSPLTNLPQRVSDLIGRDAEVGEITELANGHRLITLVGAGGVGKTRLSLEVARRLLSKFADGVWVAELGPLSDPELVPVAVATALGVTLASGTLSPERVASALGTRRVLLVLDNCEHVIGAAARMAEALVRADPLACVLATSREALRAPGECIYWLGPLEVPAEGLEETEGLLATGAVKLFVARMRAVDAQYSPNRAAAAIIAAICRRLDGIPLAIELAAARAAYLGVEQLALRLDDRFKLLTGGYRTALPRQQTLRATLDWSYDLLPESERLVLCRLAVFAGGFTLESAGTVAASDEVTPAGVIDCVINLVGKSLVTADIRREGVHYRLLNTTRTYAAEKLSQGGEYERCARRHAEHYRVVLEKAAAEWEMLPGAEWLARYGYQIDDVRAALDWAFSARGDVPIGTALTVASVPLWFQLSLLEECRGRVERALVSLGSGSSTDARHEMQLHAAFGLALFHSRGPVRETDAAWTNALEIAQSLDDTDYQLQALWGMWAYSITRGEYQVALTLAQRFCTLAASKPDPADLLIGHRMLANVMHYLGDQPTARQHLEHALNRYVAPVRRSQTIRILLDLRSSARAILAQILWLQGYPDQALRNAQSSVEDAQAADHALSLCYALALGECPVALSIGDLEGLEKSVARLLQHSARHSLAYWHAWARCFQGLMLTKRGDAVEGLYVLHTALDELRVIGFARGFTLLLGQLAEVLADAGQIDEGLAAVDEALARSERDEERWCIAELLRIKGAIVLRKRGLDSAAAAEGHFVQGLDWARRQGALSWELRCATSLARLRQEQGLTVQARELLGAVYGRFIEGFETADLKAAKALLATLG